jgi:predicted dithiol-disulfide oxidoreductase (DUF899 family)
MQFPNESAKYRQARKKLLAAEIALRRQVEKVAAQRRKLPPGGAVPQDYVFDSERGAVKLSELFVRGKTLLAYSFMYGPKMKAACPMCTSFLDGLDGNAQHLAQRTNLVVIAKSPLERILEYARSRRWTNLKLLSSQSNSYNRDYHGETEDGDQMPSLNVFVRRGGKIHHFYNSELLFAPTPEGQDPRHVDPIWPLWNLFDFTPEGRGKDWFPKLSYGAAS